MGTPGCLTAIRRLCMRIHRSRVRNVFGGVRESPWLPASRTIFTSTSERRWASPAAGSDKDPRGLTPANGCFACLRSMVILLVMLCHITWLPAQAPIQYRLSFSSQSALAFEGGFGEMFAVIVDSLGLDSASALLARPTQQLDEVSYFVTVTSRESVGRRAVHLVIDSSISSIAADVVASFPALPKELLEMLEPQRGVAMDFEIVGSAIRLLPSESAISLAQGHIAAAMPWFFLPARAGSGGQSKWSDTLPFSARVPGESNDSSFVADTSTGLRREWMVDPDGDFLADMEGTHNRTLGGGAMSFQTRVRGKARVTPGSSGLVDRAEIEFAEEVATSFSGSLTSSVDTRAQIRLVRTGKPK